MTVRPWWRDGQLIDLPGALVSVGEEAGLVLYERNVALLAALRDDDLVPRSSFFALEQVRKARQPRRRSIIDRPRGLVDLPAGFFHHPRTRVNDRGSVDSKDDTSEGIEAGSGIRLLPAPTSRCHRRGRNGPSPRSPGSSGCLSKSRLDGLDTSGLVEVWSGPTEPPTRLRR